MKQVHTAGNSRIFKNSSFRAFDSRCTAQWYNSPARLHDEWKYSI